MRIRNLFTTVNRLVCNNFSCVALLSATLITLPVIAAENYASNMGHSEIRFYYDHGGVAENSGEFTNFGGKLVLDEAVISNSSVAMTIQTDSLLSGVERLDTNLKKPKFFSVEAHPVITFNSTGFEKVGDSDFKIAGDLTIRGVTKPVELAAKLQHKGRHKMVSAFPSFYNGQWLGIKATTTVLRSEFGMGDFTPMISDEIRIEINMELKREY